MTEQNKGQDIESKPDTIEVEIDGEVKQFTAEDVKNLKAMQKSATEKFQKAAPALKAAENFGFSNTEDYTQVANHALETYYKLTQDGTIDEEGNLIKKDSNHQQQYGDIFKEEKPSFNADDIADRVMEKIDGKLNEQFKGFDSRMSKMERLAIHEAIKKKYPDLNNKAIQEIFSRASRNDMEGKSILDHAKDVHEESVSFLQSLEDEVIKKYGIDKDAFNRRQEMSPDGGASAIIEGKKALFKPRKKNWGEDKYNKDQNFDPKEAMKEFFNRMNFQ